MKYADFTELVKDTPLDDVPFDDHRLYIDFAVATAAIVRHQTELGPRYDVRPGDVHMPERVWRRVQNKNVVPTAEPEAVARGDIAFGAGTMVDLRNNPKGIPEAEDGVIGTNYAPFIPGVHEEAPSRHARRIHNGMLESCAVKRMDVDLEAIEKMRITERAAFCQETLSNLTPAQVMLALRGVAESNLNNENYAAELDAADKEFDQKIDGARSEHRALLKKIRERERSGEPYVPSSEMKAYHEYFSWANQARRIFGIYRDPQDTDKNTGRG